jgi:hypothetical protein
MESGNEILTIKEVCDLLADPPDHGLQADQEGQDFQLPKRLWLAIPKGPDNALDGWKVHQRPSVRKVIERVPSPSFRRW